MKNIVINYPKPDMDLDFIPCYKEEEAGDISPPKRKLFPLSQYKFRNPCDNDKCLVRMACTQPCEDEVKYHKWIRYKSQYRRWFQMLDLSMYMWGGICVGSIAVIILSILQLIYKHQ